MASEERYGTMFVVGREVTELCNGRKQKRNHDSQ
jgi:hypothetical protein